MDTAYSPLNWSCHSPLVTQAMDQQVKEQINLLSVVIYPDYHEKLQLLLYNCNRKKSIWNLWVHWTLIIMMNIYSVVMEKTIVIRKAKQLRLRCLEHRSIQSLSQPVCTAINNYHRLHNLYTSLSLTILDTGKSVIKAPADQMSSERPPPGS